MWGSHFISPGLSFLTINLEDRHLTFSSDKNNKRGSLFPLMEIVSSQYFGAEIKSVCELNPRDLNQTPTLLQHKPQNPKCWTNSLANKLIPVSLAPLNHISLMKPDFSPETRSSGCFTSYRWCSPAPRASWRTGDVLHTCDSAARPPPSSASWWSDDNRSPETSPSRARRPPCLHGAESQRKCELSEVFQCSCLCVYQRVFYLSGTSLLRNPANTNTL